MATLQDVRIVDLKASGVDWTKSNRDEGKYHFTEKRYINYRGDKQPRPQFLFRWCWNNEYTIVDWKNKWPGCEFVTTEDDYWPEGANISADGHYIFKDTVLMKIPIMVYIKQREKEIAKSEQAPDLIRKGLQAEYEQYGVNLSERELAEAGGAIHQTLASKIGS